MSLTLIRHTRVLASEGLCYGRTEVPLAPTFQAEADAVRCQLGAQPKIVYSSPAARCRSLAEVLGSDIRIDERLQELDFGNWENRRWNDLPRAELDAWAGNFVDVAPPRGESFRELTRRVESFRRDCAADNSVVVTHAGVIRAWLCLARGWPLSAAFDVIVGFSELVPV